MPDAPGLELIAQELNDAHPGTVLATYHEHGEACLIVDAAQLDAVCLPSTTAIDVGLSTFVSDDGSGSGPGSSLTLAFTASQTPYLTITEARAG